MRVCSPTELDIVAGLTVGGEECLERCEGPIVDVERLPSTKNEEGLAGLLNLYEDIKYPHHHNISYPFAMKGEDRSYTTIDKVDISQSVRKEAEINRKWQSVLMCIKASLYFQFLNLRTD